MNRLILLCVALWSAIHLQPQTNAAAPPVPPQIMQLGRGTAGAIDWHPDGHVLAVGGSLGLWLYDDNLDDVAHFPDAGSVTWLAWSPRGDQLALLDADNTVKLWDINLDSSLFDLNRSWAFPADDDFIRLYWSPEGERLAVITSDGTQILDVTTGQTLLTIPDLEYTFAWHPNGTQIAGSVDLGEEVGLQVRIWDAATGAVIHTYMSADPSLFWSVIRWSPDGSILVGMTSLPAIIYVWNTSTGDLLNQVEALWAESSRYSEMWWLDAGRQFITVSGSVSSLSRTLDMWDAQNWTQLGQSFSLGDVWKIVKHPTAAVWAGLTWNGQLMLWGLGKTEPLRVRSDHSQSAHLLVWSSDSRHLAAASSVSESISIWDVTNPDQPRSQIATVPYQGWDLDELRWSADDSALIGFQSIPQITAPGAYPTAFVVEWDTQTGEYLGTIHETPGYVAHDGSGDYLSYLVWNDDFTRVVTLSRGEPITVSTAGGENGSLSPDEDITTIDTVDEPSKISWSPDSTMLAMMTRDPQGETFAWVYDAETGDLINRLRPSFSTDPYAISWSQDSSLVALVSSRGIAGSGETEYRLDVLEVDPSSAEAAHVMTILDTDTTFYPAWHPGSRAIAVSTSLGVGIYSLEPVPVGIDAAPVVTIPHVQVSALAWSPDGKWLAGGHIDGTLRVWDVSAVTAILEP